MKRFLVCIPTECLTVYSVEAEDEDDAKQAVLAGEGEKEGYDNWEEDTDSNNWEVYQD